MTDMTSAIQKPGLTGVAPTYTACTAADKFAASRGAKYMLHYKNGASAQATGGSPNKLTDQVNQAANFPGAALSAGAFDAVTLASPGMTASSELVVYIDNADRFRDATGYINMVHPGTVTTMSVAIFGPF